MMIKIGADEIILWLRKNRRAVDVPNHGMGGLGKRIHDLIHGQLNGRHLTDHNTSYWPIEFEHFHIRDTELPKTSAQYEIDTNQLGNLFETIERW